MKKFTKIIVAVLAIAMLSVSFAGCGLVEDTEKVEKVKIQKETMLTIGDDITVSGAYYGWYFASAYEDAYQSAQFIQQFDSMSGDLGATSSAEPVADSAADSAAAPVSNSDAELVADSSAQTAPPFPQGSQPSKWYGDECQELPDGIFRLNRKFLTC